MKKANTHVPAPQSTWLNMSGVRPGDLYIEWERQVILIRVAGLPVNSVF